MKNLTGKIASYILPGIMALSSVNVFGQGSSQEIKNTYVKADSIYDLIKTHKSDSSYMVLNDRNKDETIDKVVYTYYYPGVCLEMHSLDNNYDGFFETATNRILYKNSWIEIKESGNLDYVSSLFRNFPPKRYESY